MLFNATYERYDEESLEAGDAFERGYLIRNARLRDALAMAWSELSSGYDVIEASDSRIEDARWLTAYGARNYRDGSLSNASLHPKGNVTPSSMVRLATLCGAYGTQGKAKRVLGAIVGR